MWVLLGDRPGDNAQVVTLARALGLECEEKRLRHNLFYVLPNWLLGASFLSLKRSASVSLDPPWPDVVIAIGQRSVPIARAIRARSGGEARHIHLGRPRAALHHFDLLITTPQYKMPERENVLHVDLPLQFPAPATLKHETSRWREHLSNVPKPRIALLVGGNITPYRFDRAAIDTLASAAIDLCEARNAALVITCGRRLPARSAKRLRDKTREHCYHFHSCGGDSDANPYFGYLAIADEFIVTSDSVSMISEAVATGRPVHLYSPPSRPLWWRLLDKASRFIDAAAPRQFRDRLSASGILVRRRQSDLVSQLIVRKGRAQWLGSPPIEARPIEPVNPVAPVPKAVFNRIWEVLEPNPEVHTNRGPPVSNTLPSEPIWPGQNARRCL